MTFFSFVFLSSCAAASVGLPQLVEKARVDLESSAIGPEEPFQARVKVVQLDPHSLAHSGFFRKGLTQRRALSHSSRPLFPLFLSQGRPGPAPAVKAPVSPSQNLMATELKKKGLQMWQKVAEKKEKMSLPVSLKESKQTCTSVPFTQHVTAHGCQTVMVHNKLCFGQCSSLFVPSQGESAELSREMGAFHRRGPCSRCAPSRAHTIPVLLQCGAVSREERVMVVEECRCETSREERSTEAAAHLEPSVDAPYVQI
ncbi:DAN domain family member 5 [Nematolebias whitei]|uniref:DAN domain family member 5 n=1 Tax=Nematolebias whitei TaxID=451745 RepID=UPI001898BEF5|nr:DAN domain family member 5 [Nematolebias whitei]